MGGASTFWSLQELFTQLQPSTKTQELFQGSLLPGYKTLNRHPWNQRGYWKFWKPMWVFLMCSHTSEDPSLRAFIAICDITYWVVSLLCQAVSSLKK